MTIYEQLQNYCDCVDIEDDDYRAYIDEAVNLISMATCWTDSPCETFLLGERKEVIDLGECGECPIVFRPKYSPFDSETFTFTLVEREGISESSTVLTDVAYSEVDGSFLIDPSLPSCKCLTQCGCGTQYFLIVTYYAGYELLPDCLLPVFCNLLNVIKNKNRCDCETCQDCTTDNENSGVTYPTGDIVSASLESYLGQLLNGQYRKQLGLLSLCEYDPRVIWGVSV